MPLSIDPLSANQSMTGKNNDSWRDWEKLPSGVSKNQMSRSCAEIDELVKAVAAHVEIQES
jgi:hypothetical protein